MIAIYQITAFFAISLIAITVTIYVLGVSLLGRAIKQATQAKLQVEMEKAAIEKTQQEEMRTKLNDKNTKYDEKQRAEMMQKLKKHEKESKKYKKKMQKIENGPFLLTVKGGVILPGTIQIIGFFTILLAINLTELLKNRLLFETITIPHIVWLFGLSLLFVSIFHIIKTLTEIQNIAIESEQQAHKKTIAAFVEALKEREDQSKPVLKLELLNELPVRIVKGNTHTLKFGLYLSKGESAHKVDVMFFSSPEDGFEFPGSHTIVQPTTSPLPYFLTTQIKWEEVIDALKEGFELNIKAPQKTGDHSIWYRISCRGFSGSYEFIEIHVIDS